MTKIAILASHNGSAFDALYEASKNVLDIEIVLIITNNTDANILQKAKSNTIDSYIINNKTYEDVDKKIYELLQKYDCDMVFLAGYMKKISSILTRNFTILNSHPSLLPLYGGAGMYGRFVHEAVIKNNEKTSGVTIHKVNDNYDEGEVILQKRITLNSNETIESLEKRIKQLEQTTIVEAFEKLLHSS